jgi:dTDP-4-dehydrorhamnose reductase
MVPKMKSMSTDTGSPVHTLEIWGGLECTINRIENNFRDQLHYCGHYTRDKDIEQIASLGIKKLRYPLLWEYFQSSEDGTIDWTWADKQLTELKRYGITPIAGLLHHGSGPSFTNLLDNTFPEKFAAYAAMVAAKFPWLEWYTPVNEPLTTARFSGLYGLWYPHHKDEKSFVRMLLNQVRAIVLAMQEIRVVNPMAKLVQTEDLTKTHSTPLLAYQADFENERRWLTYDLLCGKVNDQHYFYDRLIQLGIDEAELIFLQNNPCPPTIIGLNYYVTSERYLDDRLDKYPENLHGGNGLHRYVDTEAVRAGKMEGLSILLKQAWQRYHLPMAVTENQLACSREEQMRWFKKNLECCSELIRENIDIRAITVWALLGSYDWNSLLTRSEGFYEAGAFQVTEKNLRSTALAKFVASLIHTGHYDHPVLSVPGWWDRNGSEKPDMTFTNASSSSPLLIIGRSGTLGRALMETCNQRFIPYRCLSRLDIDITNERSIQTIIDKYKPWAIINAAGYVDVDKAEQETEVCFRINTKGPALLAAACQKAGIQFITFSSDLVFPGDKNSPYGEQDKVRPLNIYGSSKAQCEKMVARLCSSALIIRTSAFFGPWDQYNFVYKVIEALRNNKPFQVATDTTVSPTYVPDLAEAALNLLMDEETGVWHVTNEHALSWAEFATEIARRTGDSPAPLISRPQSEMGWKARRPLYSALESKKGVRIPNLSSALHRYFQQRQL